MIGGSSRGLAPQRRTTSQLRTFRAGHLLRAPRQDSPLWSSCSPPRANDCDLIPGRGLDARCGSDGHPPPRRQEFFLRPAGAVSSGELNLLPGHTAAVRLGWSSRAPLPGRAGAVPAVDGSGHRAFRHLPAAFLARGSCSLSGPRATLRSSAPWTPVRTGAADLPGPQICHLGRHRVRRRARHGWLRRRSRRGPARVVHAAETLRAGQPRPADAICLG